MNFARVNETTLHYRESGTRDGLPVVFVNSLGTDLRIWDDVISRLEGPYRFMQSDQRGHGLSDSPDGPYAIADFSNDLVGLLDHLEIARAVLVGVSIGGMISLEFAQRFPERVLGLVACDTGLKIGTAEAWNARIEAVQNGGLEGIADAVMQRWFTPEFLEQHAIAVQGYRHMISRQPANGYIASCMALRDADLHSSIPKTKSLVLCGTQDVSTPLALSEDLARALQTRLEVIADAGHLPNIQQPAVTAKHIQVFLETIRAEVQG